MTYCTNVTEKILLQSINYNYQKLPNTVLHYTAENDDLLRLMKTECNIVVLSVHCSQLSTILFSIVTPDCGLIQAQQCNFNMHSLRT